MLRAESGPAMRPAVMVGAAAALTAAIALQIARDERFPLDRAAAERVLYVRSPETIDRLVLGFDGLAADVYWIRALQHFGGDRLRRFEAGIKYELLYPLLDITTSLDPHFDIAYRFGAIFLSEPYPGGAGRPDLAVALLRKGIAAQPAKWEFHHDIGFIHYWVLGDYAAAAQWFARAAEQPKAPEWLGPVAASMLTLGEDRASARYLWSRLLESEQEYVRNAARRALVQLDALDQMDALQARVAAAPPPGGTYSWAALARAGVLEGMPLDPTGTPYDIDPVTGVISVSRSSPLYPMPRGARR